MSEEVAGAGAGSVVVEQPTVPHPGRVSPPAETVSTDSDTTSAEMDAAARNDFSAFEKAHLAGKQGKPLERVQKDEAGPQSADGVKDGKSVPTPKTKAKDIAADERIRARVDEAVRTATAESARRIAELEARIAGQTAAKTEPTAKPTAPAGGKETPAQKYERIMGLPGAPKLEDFDTVQAHAFAAAVFVQEQHEAEKAAAVTSEAQVKDLTARVDRFTTKLREASQADPDLKSKIPPAVLTARPLSALSQEELPSATFANLVAEAAFHAEHPAELLQHLHKPENQARTVEIAQMSPSDALRALAAIDGRIGATLSTSTKAPASGPDGKPVAAPKAPATRSTVSAAPPPAPTLSSKAGDTDPKAAAFARGDFQTWERLDTAERLAKRRGGATA